MLPRVCSQLAGNSPEQSLIDEGYKDILSGMTHALALAQAGEWDALEDESPHLLLLFKRAEQLAAAPGVSGKGDDTSAQIRSVLQKIDEFRQVLLPRHQELAQRIVGQATTEKLRKAYGP